MGKTDGGEGRSGRASHRSESLGTDYAWRLGPTLHRYGQLSEEDSSHRDDCPQRFPGPPDMLQETLRASYRRLCRLPGSEAQRDQADFPEARIDPRQASVRGSEIRV